MSNFCFLEFLVHYFDIFRFINDEDTDEDIDKLKTNYYNEFQEILTSKYNENIQVQEQEH